MKDVLQTGCLIIGILCLFYFVLIICYAGLSEWFMWIWMLAGGVFLLQWRLLLYERLHPESRVSLLTGSIFLVMLCAVSLIVWLGVKVINGMQVVPRQDLEYVLVLGARVKEDRPTRALRKRLDTAIAYAQKNPETTFILAGGQGPDEGISEAQCMYQYMKEKGMDVQRLIMEDKSTSTRENMCFSAVFLNREKDSVGIVSNNFHIYRALLLAKKVGYQNIWGIPAPSDFWMQPHYVLREIAALFKEVIV